MPTVSLTLRREILTCDPALKSRCLFSFRKLRTAMPNAQRQNFRIPGS